MHQFIARQNVARFRSELEKGVEEPRRTILVKLLVQEEDLLGLTREQFDEMNCQIERIKQIVALQLETLVMMRANGHPLDVTEKKLSDLVELLVLHQQHRDKIAAVL